MRPWAQNFSLLRGGCQRAPIVVEAEEPSHGLIIAESDGRRHRVQTLSVQVEEANDER